LTRRLLTCLGTNRRREGDKKREGEKGNWGKKEKEIR